jgi:UDP-N-acetylglucosamine diphosphorylase/glucosamine-1-phosphate N-acetyltransferase
MAIIFFDDSAYQSLLPLTYTRPVANLRIGILTIAEKWAQQLQLDYSYHTRAYLQGKFPLQIGVDNLFINGAVCPDEALLTAVPQLQTGQALKCQDRLVAIRLNEAAARSFNPDDAFDNAISVTHLPVHIRYPEHLFRYNDVELRKDFNFITKGRKSTEISSTNVIIGTDFFAEEGAEAECSTFNTTSGPIYLGKNSSVWEGCHIRGAFALCHDSQVKMGAKIYGATTVGPFSRVGGEVSNALIWGYSNKGHEGFLGNSVLGEWCNIGADSNNSNLKNNYADVKLFDYASGRYRGTGLQFCGLIMGDHAKCGINTMFNTGTVVGVGANVYGAGYPVNHVPDFSWGGADGFEEHKIDKMLETTARVFARREGRDFNENEQQILREVFELTRSFRE